MFLSQKFGTYLQTNKKGLLTFQDMHKTEDPMFTMPFLPKYRPNMHENNTTTKWKQQNQVKSCFSKMENPFRSEQKGGGGKDFSKE